MVLALVALLALVAAVGGLAWVRVYDDQLVRQTEAELLAQGAVVAQWVRQETLSRVVGQYGVAQTQQPLRAADGTLEPLLPTLDASAKVLPAPAPLAATSPPDPVALQVGQLVEPLLVDVSRRTLAGLRVVDVHGVVVASSHVASRGASFAQREEFQRALTGVPASVLRARETHADDSPLESLSRDNAVRVVVAVPVTHEGRVYGVVLLVRTPMTLAKAVYGDRWQLLATLTVLLAVLALVSVGLGAVLVRPLRSLVHQTRAIGRGELAGPIRQPVVAELAELSAALAHMARQLEARGAYIRDFAASVSHEFKTPLASIRGAVELLSSEAERLSGEQRTKLLANVQRDAERLTRLVQELLGLARADHAQGPAALLDVSAVVARVAERARVAGQRVTVHLPILPAVRMPPEALEQVLGHLFENARAHAGAAAQLLVSGGADTQSVWLTVRDDGPGISAANQARIFDAFFTTAREQGGTGLGLAIVAALMRAFGGRASLEVHEGPGAWFRLDWPRG